jgi:GNAT superfamily N-acetyltransferase
MKPQPAGGVRRATSEEEVRRCFPVMQQLRTHLTLERYLDFVTRMQAKEGYELAYAEEAGAVTAVAGYRYLNMLYTDGKVLYVDDLVTDPDLRSRGYGHALIAWLTEEARRNGCVELHLDSGVQRFDAHRFYFSERMHISSYHFRLKLDR